MNWLEIILIIFTLAATVHWFNRRLKRKSAAKYFTASYTHYEADEDQVDFTAAAKSISDDIDSKVLNEATYSRNESRRAK